MIDKLISKNKWIKHTYWKNDFHFWNTVVIETHISLGNILQQLTQMLKDMLRKKNVTQHDLHILLTCHFIIHMEGTRPQIGQGYPLLGKSCNDTKHLWQFNVQLLLWIKKMWSRLKFLFSQVKHKKTETAEKSVMRLKFLKVDKKGYTFSSVCENLPFQMPFKNRGFLFL